MQEMPLQLHPATILVAVIAFLNQFKDKKDTFSLPKIGIKEGKRAEMLAKLKLLRIYKKT